MAGGQHPARADVEGGQGTTRVRSPLLCPSAQPGMKGARAIGLVDHEAETPEVVYLEQPVSVTAELLEMTGTVAATELFRFAAPCQTSVCSHWDGAECKLVDRIVKLLPVASLVLPKCHIRDECRWYQQEGRNACSRCPRVITQNEDPSPAMREAATPK